MATKCQYWMFKFKINYSFGLNSNFNSMITILPFSLIRHPQSQCLLKSILYNLNRIFLFLDFFLLYSCQFWRLIPSKQLFLTAVFIIFLLILLNFEALTVYFIVVVVIAGDKGHILVENKFFKFCHHFFVY